MPSSIKMIKSDNVVGGKTTAKIDTKINADDDKSESETQVKIAKKKSQDLLSNEERKRQQLIEETQKEIEDMKQTAYEEAYQNGLETGHREGYQAGMSKGMKQAELENEEAKANIQTMYQEALVAVEDYQKDKKDEIIQLASHMAEKIIHKEIDADDKGILQLAKPYFYQLDKEEEFVSIIVHPSQRERIEQHLPKIQEGLPGTRFVVFSDPTLEEKGIIIESSKTVIDLQIKKQLDAILQEFEEMERTVDA